MKAQRKRTLRTAFKRLGSPMLVKLAKPERIVVMHQHPSERESTDQRARMYARTLRPEPWRTARATQLDVAVSFVLGLVTALVWLHAFGSPF